MLKLQYNKEGVWTDIQYMDITKYDSSKTEWLTHIVYNANWLYKMILIDGEDAATKVTDPDNYNIEDYIEKDNTTGFAIVKWADLIAAGVSMDANTYVALVGTTNTSIPEFQVTINTAFPESEYTLRAPMRVKAEGNSYSNVAIELVDMNPNGGLATSTNEDNRVYLIDSQNTATLQITLDAGTVLNDGSSIEFDMVVAVKGDFEAGYYRDVVLTVSGEVVS